MAYKFKIGDKVKVIAGKKRLENIGISSNLQNNIGKIIKIGELTKLPYKGYFEGLELYLAAKDLELAEDKTKFELTLYAKEGIAKLKDKPEDKPSFSSVRTFGTGATRDTDVNKLDYEAFFSPLVLKRYAEYLNKHRVQSDGTLRDGDNWQRGLPKDVYMKSKIRHGMQTWLLFDGFPTTDEKGNSIDIEESLCAEIFNAMGYLFELLKEKK